MDSDESKPANVGQVREEKPSGRETDPAPVPLPVVPVLEPKWTSGAPSRAEGDGSGPPELVQHAHERAKALAECAGALPESRASAALRVFDQIAVLVHGAEEPDSDIREILLDARDDLIDAILASSTRRQKAACASLRGLVEGLFSSLLYRQQAISLNLWSANAGFQMVHSFYEEKHEFYKYYARLFNDERFRRQYPGVSTKVVFKEFRDLYDTLSAHVHKSVASARELNQTLDDLLERTFRIFLTFLERETDLPDLDFPRPLTFAATKRQG